MNKLLEYLPLFVAGYKEMKEISRAELPELSQMSGNINTTKNDQFITSCDIDGIERFERILGITPSEYDTLDSRISRALFRWNDRVPYSWRVFVNKMVSICGNDFQLIPDWDKYRLEIMTYLDLFGQMDELENVIDYMLPANIAVTVNNRLNYALDINIYLTGGLALCDIFELSENFSVKWEVNGNLSAAALGSGSCEIEITDTNKDIITVNNNIYGDPHISQTEII